LTEKQLNILRTRYSRRAYDAKTVIGFPEPYYQIDQPCICEEFSKGNLCGNCPLRSCGSLARHFGRSDDILLYIDKIIWKTKSNDEFKQFFNNVITWLNGFERVRKDREQV
jgi:hypothetical protein